MKKDENRTICGQSVIVDLPTAKNGKNKDYYIKWHDVFRRCYNPTVQKKYPTYIGCTVCSEWHTLSAFKDWYYAQPNYGKADMTLDKDILVRGNKIYGPLYCRLVPRRINSLLLDCQASRGAYPVGVSFIKGVGKYRSQCSNGSGAHKNLGRFNTVDEAFTTYKTYKEALINTVAEDYYTQNLITSDIRFALINWTITK